MAFNVENDFTNLASCGSKNIGIQNHSIWSKSVSINKKPPYLLGLF